MAAVAEPVSVEKSSSHYVYPASPELYAKASEITPRYPKLDFGPIQSNPKDWYDNDPVITEFFHALSLVFPQGEKFFVQAVAHYSKDIKEPELKKQVRAFSAQETQHSAQHWAFNKRIGEEYGHQKTVEWVDGFVKQVFAIFKSRFTNPAMPSLYATCALEHFTAMLANTVLATKQGKEVLSKMPLPYRQLWTWHAVEEIEHKAVAFDVMKAVGGTYFGRVRQYLITSYLFPFHISYILCKLLKNRGLLWKVKTWWTLFKFIFVSPGLFFFIVKPWLTYLRPSFHPWDERNAYLIKEFEASTGAKPSNKKAAPVPGETLTEIEVPLSELDQDIVLAKEQLGFDQINIE